MTASSFATRNETWRQLLGNGLSYVVPRFQRDYSWTEDEWDDLWQDILGTLESGGEPAHYMGYLVLQTRDDKTFDVIDGQQRLTTLSLLALAVLKALQDLVDRNIEPQDNRRRIDQLRSSHIGFLDPVTLVSRSKLTLNRNIDSYYQDYLVPLQRFPAHRHRPAAQALRKAFEWHRKKVQDRFAGTTDGAQLARFLEALSDRLFFTVISVADELNAFKVFETLNARGVRLSPTDLLKNYLFSVVHRERGDAGELDALERRWESLVSQLVGDNFTDFLRTHWNSRKDFVREAELFKRMRSQTTTRGSVFDLLREMEADIGVFAAFSDPASAVWSPEQRVHVRELRLFNVRQARPLLLAAHRRFDAAGFTAVLRACSIISFRYNVIGGFATGEQERIYNSVAEHVSSGRLGSAGDTIRALAPIYPADAQFMSAFAEKSLVTTAQRNKAVARYILLSIERHLSGLEHDPDSAQLSIEHVLPESPEDGWEQFTAPQVEEYMYRLGNLTLLAASDNRAIGNAPFSDKKAAYAGSQFETTRLIEAENADWTPDRIAHRQQWMARQATAIWRIAQLA